MIMELDVGLIFSSIWTAFAQSAFFYYLKIVAGFIVAVLLIADILLLSKRLQGDVKIALFGSKAPRFKKSAYANKWETIKKGAEESSVSAGKIAVIKADKMLGEVLAKIGYKGEDTGEKLSMVKLGQLAGKEEAMGAHEVCKRIVMDPSYHAEISELRRALDGYEKVFRGLELLD